MFFVLLFVLQHYSIAKLKMLFLRFVFKDEYNNACHSSVGQ